MMKILTSYTIVFVGAGLGGSLRYAVHILAARLLRPEWPIATLSVNIVGSFAAGVLAGYLLPRGNDAESIRLFALTGVLGGFTTFSAFSLDAVRLIDRGSLVGAVAYSVGSVVLAVAGVFAGMALARP